MTEISTGGCSSDNLSPSSSSITIDQNQNSLLNTTRQRSSIPQQMFFNAMKRKNWNPNTEDMKVIVPIHNAVNEKAWKEILEWEKLHENKCGGPRLINFQGRSKDFTPKARILNLLGYKLPFDRHDWVIDRCGKHVTYIIDFYSGQPDPKFPERVASFYLDVRPALTFNGTIDRIRKWVNSWLV
ncbi:13693_t:CDS:2 [Entrophospora sp. SA101]|nr:6655_t:CDS:2 [Entrophospora sp. SA101]CAJ0916896.1 13693_t:CDS:2 [Entrophospora sp. SA101]